MKFYNMLQLQNIFFYIQVDRILEVHYKRDGTREFLVSWKGYKSADNSWEPEENMTCPDLIAKFMQKVEKAKSASPRELREKRAHTQRFTLSSDLHGRRLSKRNVGKQRCVTLKFYHIQEKYFVPIFIQVLMGAGF